MGCYDTILKSTTPKIFFCVVKVVTPYLNSPT